MILYHGTSKEQQQKILKDGFEKRDSGITVNGNKIFGAYLTDQYEEANTYAWRNSKNNKCDMAIIAVDVSGLNIVSLLRHTITMEDSDKLYELYNSRKSNGVDGVIHNLAGEDYYLIFNIEKLNSKIIKP